ncbi:hypothetical protein Rhal01_03033 [Rubritalea halochordaticola]|uniref:Zinc-finger domain-containing protein n=1 Tax=Rubritalea halochordaticola TaxID=714537 RepID=A0ABP9V2F5_9BACT
MKDTCEQTMTRLSDHYDEGNTLTSDLAQHISACPECAEFHQQWGPAGSLSELASITQFAETPADLADTIMAEINTRQTEPKPSDKTSILKIWIPLAVAACIGLLIAIQPETQPHAQSPTAYTQETQTSHQQQATPKDLSQVKLAINSLPINQEKISISLHTISESGTELINERSKQISKLASGIEHFSTNLSKMIPRIPADSNEQTSNLPLDLRA